MTERDYSEQGSIDKKLEIVQQSFYVAEYLADRNEGKKGLEVLTEAANALAKIDNKTQSDNEGRRQLYERALTAFYRKQWGITQN